jgi:hypothetical protein
MLLVQALEQGAQLRPKPPQLLLVRRGQLLKQNFTTLGK